MFTSGGGHELMKRMMSSEAVKEVPEKKDEVPEKKKEGGGGEVVASSYWGVARPRITKEDGTEWPWNCFMVIFFEFSSFSSFRLIIFMYRFDFDFLFVQFV